MLLFEELKKKAKVELDVEGKRTAAVLRLTSDHSSPYLDKYNHLCHGKTTLALCPNVAQCNKASNVNLVNVYLVKNKK